MDTVSYANSKSDFDIIQDVLYTKISEKIISQRKTDMAGIITMNSKITRNRFQVDSQYSGVAVASGITMFTPEILENMRKNEVLLSDTSDTDVVSAFIVAIDAMKTFVGTKSYVKKIYVLTNGLHKVSKESQVTMNDIREECRKNNIEVIVVGVCFDSFDMDADYVEDNKPELRATNEIMWNFFATNTRKESVVLEAEQFRRSLELGQIKTFKPVPTFAAGLEIGEGAAININVQVFPAVRQAAPPNTTAVAPVSIGEDGVEGVIRSSVHRYKKSSDSKKTISDDHKPEDQFEEVDDKLLLDGYRFGYDIVMMTPSNLELLHSKPREEAGIRVLSFVPEDSIKRYMGLVSASFVVGLGGLPYNTRALSSLSQALWKTKTAAVARVVSKEGKDPILCGLFPEINKDSQHLIMVQIPFAQDVRHFNFPQLGEVKIQHKVDGMLHITKTKEYPELIPDSEMQDAMDKLVDDLPCDYLTEINTVRNPLLHHIKNAVRECALADSVDKISPIVPALIKYSKPSVESLNVFAKIDRVLATQLIEAKKRKRKMGAKQDVKAEAEPFEKEPKLELQESTVASLEYVMEELPVDQKIAAKVGSYNEAEYNKIVANLATSLDKSDIEEVRRSLTSLQKLILKERKLIQDATTFLGERVAEGKIPNDTLDEVDQMLFTLQKLNS